METSLNTLSYAKKLRTRLAALKARRTKNLKRYDIELKAWKLALKNWVLENVDDRIKKMTRTAIGNGRTHYHDGWSTNFFIGAPKEPRKSNEDKLIQDIQGLLRHLAITGQKTIRVSTRDVERYFADETEDD
jgi:hypothetical protein